MKTYRIYQVDAFTKELFRGNPAGVVTNAEGLSEGQMLAIARELNNSETAFVLPAEGDDHDIRVRFFTPTMEVPLCGHATVSTHYVRALEEGMDTCRVVQKTGAGLIPVDIVKQADGDYAITMTQGAISIGETFAPELVEEIARALGFGPERIRSDCPVCIASTGYGKVMVAIDSNELLHSLKPDNAALIAISKKIGCNGYYVFTVNPGQEDLVHGRMFSPAGGIPEDPVTGNANGPLGAYLVHFGLCQEGVEDHFSFRIAQGEAMGRAGNMQVDVDVVDGEPVLVKLTGAAVVAFSAEIKL